MMSGACAIERHHAVGLELEQIFRGEVLRIPEWSAKYADSAQMYGTCATERIVDACTARCLGVRDVAEWIECKSSGD